MRKLLYGLAAAAMLTATLGMSVSPAEARLRDKVKAAAQRANISKSSVTTVVKCTAKVILKKAGPYGC